METRRMPGKFPLKACWCLSPSLNSQPIGISVQRNAYSYQDISHSQHVSFVISKRRLSMINPWKSLVCESVLTLVCETKIALSGDWSGGQPWVREFPSSLMGPRSSWVAPEMVGPCCGAFRAGLCLVPWAARPGSRSHHCVIVQAILFYKQSSWLS